MAVALLLPITYGLDVTESMVIFAGIYYGGMYGGSTTSILLNTPGESASVMTAIEGNKMAKRGRAAQALATAAIGSFIAGTIGTLLVAFFTPALADQAIKVGAPSFFASLGAYSVAQDPFDLALLLIFGGVGFAIRRFGIPVLPLILGVILAR